MIYGGTKGPLWNIQKGLISLLQKIGSETVHSIFNETSGRTIP